MTGFIDTHSHLNDKAYCEDAHETINRALKAGVFKILLPDIDSTDRDSLFSICEKYKNVLYPMLGLYPGSVDENWESEIDKMMQYTDHQIIAIGEIGLDYHYSSDTAGRQQEALIRQFEIAAKLDLPVNIHLRDATDDFFKVMDICRHLGLRGNLHAFSGSYEIFQRLQKYGEWYVGIGGVVTFKNSHISESVKKIPLERIILETDSPYLTPVPYRGKRNESSYIPLIAEKIALLKNISIEEVAATTTHNATTLFRI